MIRLAERHGAYIYIVSSFLCLFIPVMFFMLLMALIYQSFLYFGHEVPVYLVYFAILLISVLISRVIANFYIGFFLFTPHFFRFFCGDRNLIGRDWYDPLPFWKKFLGIKNENEGNQAP